jgi:hypothetical protein
MLKHVVVVTALAVVAVVAAGCPARPDTKIEPIKIGVLNPISGALASLGPDWEDAARLAEEDVNAGGGVFDGRPLELVFEDSGTDPDVAVSSAKKLIEDDKVVGLVGPATSGESTRVLSDVTANAEIPMISCCATATELTEGNSPNNGFFFRTTPSDKLQGKALAFIAKQGLAGGAVDAEPCPRVAFMFRNDAYGSGFQSVFQDNYEGVAVSGGGPGTIAATEHYGDPDHEANQAELQQAATALVSDIDDAFPGDVAVPHMCIVTISFDVDGAEVIKDIDTISSATAPTHRRSRPPSAPSPAATSRDASWARCRFMRSTRRTTSS